MLRKFPQCFIARNLVDIVMKLKLARSRRESVHLIRKLNQKVFCCKHVCIEHEFQDEYLFFRFIPASQRMREPVLEEKPSLKSHWRKKAKGKRRIKTKQNNRDRLQLQHPIPPLHQTLQPPSLRFQSPPPLLSTLRPQLPLSLPSNHVTPLLQNLICYKTPNPTTQPESLIP